MYVLLFYEKKFFMTIVLHIANKMTGLKRMGKTLLPCFISGKVFALVNQTF